jgi:hypothetical protein
MIHDVVEGVKVQLLYINALINETLRRPVAMLGGMPHAVAQDDEYQGMYTSSSSCASGPRVAGLKEANETNIMGSNMISLMYVSSLSIGAPLKRDSTYATLAKTVEPLGMDLGEG